MTGPFAISVRRDAVNGFRTVHCRLPAPVFEAQIKLARLSGFPTVQAYLETDFDVIVGLAVARDLERADKRTGSKLRWCWFSSGEASLWLDVPDADWQSLKKAARRNRLPVAVYFRRSIEALSLVERRPVRTGMIVGRYAS